jgi:hypothetical protein
MRQRKKAGYEMLEEFRKKWNSKYKYVGDSRERAGLKENGLKFTIGAKFTTGF